MTDLFTNLVFGAFCLIAITGALYILLTDNLLYAAFGLLVSLLGVAGLFVFAGAEFVSVSQIMIYIGGILVLIIFGILLSNKKSSPNDKKNMLYVGSRDSLLTMILSVGLFLVLIFFVTSLSFKIHTDTAPGVSHVRSLGFSLMTDHVFILEAVGLLLLGALIGSTYLSRNHE